MNTKIIVLVFFLFYFTKVPAQRNPATDSLLTVQLFRAIRSGDAAAVELLLQKGAPANGVLNNYSALMAAALSGSVEQMKILLDHGADINYFNKDSISAIWLAVPDNDKTHLLLEKGASVQQISREGNNLLVKLSGIPGSAALMQVLINKGCSPRNSGRANDIMYNAAGSGDTALAGLLLRNGVPVNDTSCTGDYPINAALNFRSIATLKMLVEHGADVNATTRTAVLPLLAGITPLMWAAVSNDKASFYYLLDHGADAKAKSPGGYTILMFLARSEQDDPAMTQALIDRGVSPTAKAFDDTDALYHARLRGNTASVAILSTYVSKKQ
jgi:uncharacterized protein